MKEALLMKLIEALLDSDSSEAPQEKEMIGEYVIVRCRDAGVHAGYLKSYEGREVVLTNSRRLWYWEAVQGHTLSAVAHHGITSNSKIPAVVKSLVLPECCEIISTTENAQKSIEEQPAHEVN